MKNDLGTHKLDGFDLSIVDVVSDLLRDAAARIVLPLFLNLGDDDIQTKTHANDFVTKADIDAEVFLTQALRALLPDSLVVGEEAVSRDSSVLERLQEDKWCWILDPVDGTYEFRHGRAGFRMLVALAYKGEPYMGWILTPNVEKKEAENQTVLCAVKGRGAWVNRFEAGERIVVSALEPEEASLAGVLVTYDPVVLHAFNQKPSVLGARITWGVGAEFDAMVRKPCGTVDWISFDRCHITPWDFAGPYVVLTEAGGVWCQADKAPYRASKDNAIRFIAARNQRVVDLVREKIYLECVP